MKGARLAVLFLPVALVLLALSCVPRLGALWYANQCMLYLAQCFDQNRGSLAEKHHLGNQAYRYLQFALSLDLARLDERLSSYLARLEVFEARDGRRAEVLAADELLAAGRALEVRGRAEQAVVAYQSSVAPNPRLVEAYTGWYTSTPSQVIDVPCVQRHGWPSSVLRLGNAAGGPSAKKTGDLRFDLPGPYLGAGWLYVEGGSTGCTGYHCYLAAENTPEFEPLACVVEPPSSWAHVAGLIYPRPDDKWPTVLLRNSGPGQVLVDDILFAPLELPQEVQEKLSCTAP